MYYVVEFIHVGPKEDHVDCHVIEIKMSPAINNKNYEERTAGWCGTTNDRAAYAHGEYATIEDARAAIAARFGEVRDSDSNGNRFESDDADVVEVYKPGKYAPLSSQATYDWCYAGIQADVDADTTDANIDALVAEYEAEANNNGYSLDSDLMRFMHERRQALRDAQGDEE